MDLDSLAGDILAGAARRLTTTARVPSSTYRLQLGPSLDFAAARALVPYLEALGAGDVYCSPIFAAAPGSAHGYDVIDHARVSAELGGAEGFAALSAEARARGLGLLLDVVPNHMGIEGDNPLWLDVLELGPSSEWARTFDIDWAPVKEELQGKILLPILGDQYGAVLERGEIRLELSDAGALSVRYFDRRLPIAPRQYALVLGHRLGELRARLGAGAPGLVELESILFSLEHLPSRVATDPREIAERRREKDVVKRRLASLCAAAPAVRAFLEENVRLFNGDVSDRASFDLLDRLLGRQVYRLAHWRVAAEEINYRRFFDINGLAAIRVEDPRVFEEAHAAVFDLVRRGLVTGLRVDHPDGLYAPRAYFTALQERRALDACDEELTALGVDATTRSALAPVLSARLASDVQRLGARSPFFRPLYVVAEKILAEGEHMPAWPIHGTTGYDFLTAVNALFVDRAGARHLDEGYSRLVGHRVAFGELAYESKKLIMSTTMASEIDVLGRELNRVSETNRRTRDFTKGSLTRAIVEVIACFPVYRTYAEPGDVPVGPRCREIVDFAISAAKRRNPAVAASVFDFVADVLLKNDEVLGASGRDARTAFVLKLQQITGPIAAKGVEDTAFYVYNRLTSLCEVGGDPRILGATPERFHEQNAARQREWPASLLATSTHDTKRSEDVRVRIDALTEDGLGWRRQVAQWTRQNRRKKRVVHGRPAPDRNEELLLYQTLVGAWPGNPGETLKPEARTAFRLRVRAYLQKATKEAKVNTSWVNPDSAYDHALSGFVDALLDAPADDPFLASLVAFVAPVIRAGRYNSLAQTLLKLASPGVADIYQGSELWDLSLVDPDNRRPVDFALRRRLLAELDAERDPAALARRLAVDVDDPRGKLLVTSRGLRLRRELPALFIDGSYAGLPLRGPRENHAVALLRAGGGRTALVAAPRLTRALFGPDLRLPDDGAAFDGTWALVPGERPGAVFRDAFTGRTMALGAHDGQAALSLREAFAGFPVALLVR